VQAQQPATLLREGLTPSRGLPIGDLRGFGRVRADAALECLTLDRSKPALTSSYTDRPLLLLEVDGAVAWDQAYVPGTNVIESTGHVGGAEVRVVDFMPLAEGRPGQGDAIAAGRFVRIVTCTEGEVVFRMVCGLAVDALPGLEGRTVDGSYVACSHPLDFTDERASASVRLRAGQSAALVIAASPLDGGPTLIADTLHGLGDTIHYWTWWSDRCRYKGEDFDERLREVLQLKLACGTEAGMICEQPGAHGYELAPLGECSRAAARFLALGYRQECVDLLTHVHGQSAAVDAVSWSADEAFVSTLASYLERYGDVGLPPALRHAAPPHTDPLRAV
jgi:hypothetical protein